LNLKKNKLKKVVYILFISLFLIKLSYSQSIQFSQFYSAPLVLAPSFAGAVKNSRFIANFRDQWPSIPGTYTTFAASYDQNFEDISSGLGFLAVRDQAGAGNLSLTEFGALYSWQGVITKSNGGFYIRPGINFKMSQRSIDFQKLIFSDMISPDGSVTNITIEQPPLPRKFYLDAATSIIFYNPKYFWSGISVDHLFRPNESLYLNEDTRVSMKYSIFAGYKMNVGKTHSRLYNDKDNDNMTFTAHYRYQGKYDQLDIGTYWTHNPITLGMWLRGLPLASRPSLKEEHRFQNLDAIIFLVGYEIFDLRIGYSYDLTISDLLGASGGAHEISVMYEFKSGLDTKKKHAIIPCPSF